MDHHGTSKGQANGNVNVCFRRVGRLIRSFINVYLYTYILYIVYIYNILYIYIVYILCLA